jgi:hypothetical protein
MATPQITIHDAITGESVVRDMTKKEIDALEVVSDIKPPIPTPADE